MKKKRNPEPLNYIVQSAREEPSKRELNKRRTEFYKKLSKITPDQLKEFSINPTFEVDPFESKLMWSKTIWAK